MLKNNTNIINKTIFYVLQGVQLAHLYLTDVLGSYVWLTEILYKLHNIHNVFFWIH